jgi:hypothetical protein
MCTYMYACVCANIYVKVPSMCEFKYVLLAGLLQEVYWKDLPEHVITMDASLLITHMWYTKFPGSRLYSL